MILLPILSQHCGKISADLQVAGHIAKKLSIRLLQYVRENPVDATFIAGGDRLYLISSKLIRAMTASRCPTCVRSCHEMNA